MMTWRVAALALTILVSGAVAPIVVDVFGGNEGTFSGSIRGHRAMGIFVAVLIVVGTLPVFVLTRDAPKGAVVESEKTLRAQLRVAARNRPFRVLVACFVAQAAGVAAMLAGVQYFADHVLHRHSAVTLLFVCVVGPAILVMPLWNRIGARIGKLKGYVFASLMITAGTLGLVTAPLLPIWAVYFIIGIIGCGYAGQQLFGLAMLPDCIAYDTIRTGKRQAGVFTGLWTAGETFGLALGPYIFGQTIELFGYVPSNTGDAAHQSSTAELGVLVASRSCPASCRPGAALPARVPARPAARPTSHVALAGPGGTAALGPPAPAPADRGAASGRPLQHLRLLGLRLRCATGAVPAAPG
jgi:Na+/melibiose symporter-like transporter